MSKIWMVKEEYVSVEGRITEKMHKIAFNTRELAADYMHKKCKELLDIYNYRNVSSGKEAIYYWASLCVNTFEDVILTKPRTLERLTLSTIPIELKEA